MEGCSYLVCPICREPFDNCIRKPLILLCGHSLCQSCRNDSLEVRVSNGAVCTCEENSGNLCENCRGTSCSICRFPRAIQIEVLDTFLLEHLKDTSTAFTQISCDKLKTCAELIKTDRNLDALKITMEEYKEEVANLEAMKNELNKLQKIEASLGKLYGCRNCQTRSLPSARVHVCLLCSDNENISLDTGIYMIKKDDMIENNFLCDFCTIYNKCNNAADGKHQTKTYDKLQLLTDIEYEINRICASYDKMDFDIRHPYLFDMRWKYQNSQSDGEKAEIKEDIDNFIQNSRRTILTLQKT